MRRNVALTRFLLLLLFCVSIRISQLGLPKLSSEGSFAFRNSLNATEKKSTPLNIYFTPAAASNGWFTTNNIAIAFDPPISPTDIQGYSLLLSQSPFYEADLVSDTTERHWRFENIPEGSAYLTMHAQKKDGYWIKGSAVRVKVDTLAPPPPNLIQCFDSLFAKHQLAPAQPQSLSNRPYFKWIQKAASDGESPITHFNLSWAKADGTVIEQTECRSTNFFPARAVAPGTYRLTITSLDEAGWESTAGASFEFVYGNGSQDHSLK